MAHACAGIVPRVTKASAAATGAKGSVAPAGAKTAKSAKTAKTAKAADKPEATDAVTETSVPSADTASDSTSADAALSAQHATADGQAEEEAVSQWVDGIEISPEIGLAGHYRPSFNVCPMRATPVLRRTRDGHIRLQTMKWGTF